MLLVLRQYKFKRGLGLLVINKQGLELLVINKQGLKLLVINAH